MQTPKRWLPAYPYKEAKLLVATDWQREISNRSDIHTPILAHTMTMITEMLTMVLHEEASRVTAERMHAWTPNMLALQAMRSYAPTWVKLSRLVESAPAFSSATEEIKNGVSCPVFCKHRSWRRLPNTDNFHSPSWRNWELNSPHKTKVPAPACVFALACCGKPFRPKSSLSAAPVSLTSSNCH